MLIRALPILSLALLAASCGESPAPEGETAESPASTAEDPEVAAVKAANDAPPPLAEIELQGIGYPDIEQHDLYGVGCNFAPKNGGLAAVFLGQDDRGVIKLGGDIVTLAADKGSPTLPYSAHEHYVGTEYSADLTVSGEGSPSGEEAVDYAGQLVIRDAHERTLYDEAGIVQCGA